MRFHTGFEIIEPELRKLLGLTKAWLVIFSAALCFLGLALPLGGSIFKPLGLEFGVKRLRGRSSAFISPSSKRIPKAWSTQQQCAGLCMKPFNGRRGRELFGCRFSPVIHKFRLHTCVYMYAQNYRDIQT